MKTAIIRLDGVLIPPIWRQIAQVTRIPDLLAVPNQPSIDAAALLHKRLLILRHHKLTLDDLKFIVSMYSPMAGAAAFIRALVREYRVIVMTDALPELARYFTELFPDVELHFPWSAIYGKDFSRIAIQQAVSNELMATNAATKSNEMLVVGHSLADIPILEQGTARFLFRPSRRTACLAPHAAVVRHYRQIINRQLTAGMRSKE